MCSLLPGSTSTVYSSKYHGFDDRKRWTREGDRICHRCDGRQSSPRAGLHNGGRQADLRFGRRRHDLDSVYGKMDAQNGATSEKDPVTGQVATTTAAATIDDVNGWQRLPPGRSRAGPKPGR